MKVHLFAEKEVHLSDLEGDGIEVTLEKDAFYYGAIAMFVTSLGKCTYAVLSNYAMRLDLDPNEIKIQLIWDYQYDPTVISKIDMEINWPSLPETRKQAVERTSHKCTVHNTIRSCVDVSVLVNGG